MASNGDKPPVIPGGSSPEAEIPRVDAIVVGGGFSGCLLLQKLRDELKLNVKLFEAGPCLGGVWYWNRYPGARVDCTAPGYELYNPALWEKWRWKEKYPHQSELLAYFEHVDKELSLSKDCFFNSAVTSAQFLRDEKEWLVRTKDNRVVRAKYFIPAVGFASKPYVPDWKGLDSFRGTICHTSDWPREGIDVKGKRVAIVGTGSSGVQVVQEWAKEAAETFVFQRTPNICLPLHQEKLDPALQEKKDDRLAEYATSCTTFGGVPFDTTPRNTFDDTPEERQVVYETLYDQGGLTFFIGNYRDLMIDEAANSEAYRFWANKTRARLNDPHLRDLLAPLKQLHPIGAKRTSLEQDYYEQFNKPNVHLIDTRANPVTELRPNGIVAGQDFHEVDVIAIATGFDSVTGGLEKVGIKDMDGADLMERWRHDGVHTYLGLVARRCPNMFLPYSVHSPSVFSNGPITIDIQASFITDAIHKMETDGIRAINVKKEAEQAWTAEVVGIANMTLLTKAKSWYMGANIPGKRIEPLFYLGGIPRYLAMCRGTVDRNLEDFDRL